MYLRNRLFDKKFDDYVIGAYYTLDHKAHKIYARIRPTRGFKHAQGGPPLALPQYPTFIEDYYRIEKK